MFQFVVLLSAVSDALSAAVLGEIPMRYDGYIVGGRPALIDAFPWQVSLQRRSFHFCGGAIYSEDIIITAAHCLQDIHIISELKVRAGSTFWMEGGSLISVAAFIIHVDYSPKTWVNDIAIVRLSTPLIYSATIKNIALASESPADYTPAAVSGWGGSNTWEGFIAPNQLRYLSNNIVSRDACASRPYKYEKQRIRLSMICAMTNGKDFCDGDSGSPLVSDGFLVGIASFNRNCMDNPDFPGVYADVAYLRVWIISAAESIKN